MEMADHDVLAVLPPDAWETLCFFGAACDPDDRLRAICDQVLRNKDTFFDVHTRLGRRPLPGLNETLRYVPLV